MTPASSLDWEGIKPVAWRVTTPNGTVGFSTTAERANYQRVTRGNQVEPLYGPALLAEVERLRERQAQDLEEIKVWNAAWKEASAKLEAAEAERDALRQALEVFAAIKPSTFFAPDGSEGDGYEAILVDGREPQFTGADLARARSALTGGGE